jgi:hypothetical protein
LISPVKREHFGFFLSFMDPISEVLDDFQRGLRAAPQHIKVGLLPHAEDADVSHGLCGAGVCGAVERGRITTEKVTGHEHFQRAFFSVRRGLHALHRPFLDDMEVLGRIALAEYEVAFAVAGFGQLIEDALTVLPAQDAEKRNAVEPVM